MEAKQQSKVKSIIKWRSKRVTMVIAKAASRNIAFKAAKMSKTAFETQAAFVARVMGEEALSLERSRWKICLTCASTSTPLINHEA